MHWGWAGKRMAPASRRKKSGRAGQKDADPEKTRRRGQSKEEPKRKGV